MKMKSKPSAYILRGSTATLLFSCVIVALCSAIHVPEQPPKALPPHLNAAFGANAQQNRTLSFVDRVAYLRAIEEVYWRHRIWPKERPDPKPSLDAVMSQAQLEKKVAEHLRNTQALEDYWQRPISADQLQAEMERMASHTKQPEVLREIFAALGNDPLVIAECLARPVLAERFGNGDAVAGEPALSASRTGVSPASTKLFAADTAASTENRFRATNRGVTSYTLPAIASPSGGVCADNWAPMTLTNAPDGRASLTAVWTGSEMIVWGGENESGVLNTGGGYNPSTDSWTATSTADAPAARNRHRAVWTGTEMIVWGGDTFGAVRLNTGGRYNPITDSWTATSTANAPEARRHHRAVWTGTEMIVWGGEGAPFVLFNTGGRYNPTTDSWSATSITNAPSARVGHSGVWSGSEMIVWGGIDAFSTNLDTGGRYNPITDSWTATSTTNAPTARNSHTAVWSGTEMIVWGGVGSLDTGGRYNPGTGTWTSTSTTGAPDGRVGHTAVWSGSEMIVWGGSAAGVPFDTGGRYDPGTDSWAPTSTIDAPESRFGQIAVWTGNEMIVWGGDGGVAKSIKCSRCLNTGSRYCAATPRSQPTPRPRPTPVPRP